MGKASLKKDPDPSELEVAKEATTQWLQDERKAFEESKKWA